MNSSIILIAYVKFHATFNTFVGLDPKRLDGDVYLQHPGDCVRASGERTLLGARRGPNLLRVGLGPGGALAK